MMSQRTLSLNQYRVTETNQSLKSAGPNLSGTRDQFFGENSLPRTRREGDGFAHNLDLMHEQMKLTHCLHGPIPNRPRTGNSEVGGPGLI